MSIWDGNNDLACCGYTGMPQEYIDKLAEEFKKYGFATYKIGNYVIAETTDLVVITEIFKKYVPFKYIASGKFKAILGTKAELEEVERRFRIQENLAIKADIGWPSGTSKETN